MLNQYPFIKIQKGSFSGYTFEVRYQKILQDLIDSTLFDHNIKSELNHLKNELPSTKITRLETTSNNKHWVDFYLNYKNYKLLDIPFFYAEVYFFAIIREIVCYDKLKIDPFREIKQGDLEKNTHILTNAIQKNLTWETKDFVLFSLSGNKSDLSQIKDGSSLELNILIDDANTLIHYFETRESCHIIQDNSGIELFSDLLLANHLVEKYNHTVYVHLKSLPIFVSDSLVTDLNILLEVLNNERLSQELKEKIKQKKIIIKTNDYWSSPCHFSNISEEIDCTKDSLIISKGDANYRRFFSDKQLKPTFKSQNLTQYLTAPVFCIRTLKSEIQTDIPIDTVNRLERDTPNWMSNGSNAVIQYINKLPLT